MTEIKRSFYILIAFAAILLLFPLYNSARVVGNVNFDNTVVKQTLVSSVVVTSSHTSDAPVSTSANGIHGIVAKGAPSVSSPAVAGDLCKPLSDVSWSTTYGIATKEGSSIKITNAEREMIAAAAQLEVLGKYSRADQFENPDLKYYELLAVAQIVRNRLESENFPDDIKTILYDSKTTASGKVYQFSTSPYIKSTAPSELAYAAVDEVFDDGVSVLPDDYYYFCATWRESRFEINNRCVLRFLKDAGDYDKIVADATTFYAGVTMNENIANGYVF